VTQEAAAAAVDDMVVSFPDDFPNSVKHFLMIGFMGMLIGSGIFLYMGLSRKQNTMTHVLTFFICVLSAASYYAMWQGMGVMYKVLPCPAQYKHSIHTSHHTYCSLTQ